MLSIAITGSADAEYLLGARSCSAAAAVSEQTDKMHAYELGTRAPCGKNKTRSGCIGKIPWGGGFRALSEFRELGAQGNETFVPAIPSVGHTFFTNHGFTGSSLVSLFKYYFLVSTVR